MKIISTTKILWKCNFNIAEFLLNNYSFDDIILDQALWECVRCKRETKLIILLLERGADPCWDFNYIDAFHIANHHKNDTLYKLMQKYAIKNHYKLK
jgi:hypothetical protein